MKMKHSTIISSALIFLLCIASGFSLKGAWADENSDKARESLKKGLAYLKSQFKDGKCISIKMKEDEMEDVAMTAMALTAFLEAPEDIRKEYAEFVKKPLQFLADSQNEDGSFGKSNLPNYYTSVSVMALHASGEEKFKGHIEKGAKFITTLQFGEESGSSVGGIGYGSDKTKADLSNTHFALEALRAAQESGAKIDEEVFKRAEAFVKSCLNNPESNPIAKNKDDDIEHGDDGGAYYQPEGSKSGVVELPNGKKQYKSYGSMTYAAIKSLIHCKAKEDDAALVGARKWIERNFTLAENPGMKGEGLYYYYVTFAKALHVTKQDKIQDERGKKHDWRVELAETLATAQDKDGSWSNKADRWMEANPVLATSYAAMALNWSLK